jgi:hypothetical protein
MAAAVLFQPALMGPPREKLAEQPARAPAASAFADEDDELVPQPSAWAVERHGPPQVKPGHAADHREQPEHETVSDETRR